MRRLLLTSTAAQTASSLAAGLLAVVLVLLASPASWAHGDFEEGSPGPGDSVPAGEDVLALKFENINPDAAIYLALTDAGGDPVPVGTAQPAEADGGNGVVCAQAAALRPGVYELAYLLNSEDGDLTRGQYSFEVIEGADTGSVSDVRSDCADLALAQPGEAQTIDEMSSDSLPGWLVPALVIALVLVAGLVVWRVRTDRAEHVEAVRPADA